MKSWILVLALLSTESSYRNETERPATEVADTVQFWFGSNGPWRIRTYATDHDIHIYSLADEDDAEKISPIFAEQHINKHYSDILGRFHILKFPINATSDEIARELKKHGLSGMLEVAPAGFAFYNPDRQKYKTQSSPK